MTRGARIELKIRCPPYGKPIVRPRPKPCGHSGSFPIGRPAVEFAAGTGHSAMTEKRSDKRGTIVELNTDFVIKTDEQLRAHYDQPHPMVADKGVPHLTPSIRRYIELSPFACLSTQDGKGRTDISPRGDAPGFVKVADEHTLLLPDRPGNNRLDSIRNIMACPDVSLLFMIPGVLDTVRVNGRAAISVDPALLAEFPVGGKLPRSVICIEIKEALAHCAKAYRRSKLWEHDYRPEKGSVPTLREMMTDLMEIDKPMEELIDAAIEDDYRNNMY